MLGNLSSNRYWVYAILATFSWATYNYFFVSRFVMLFAAYELALMLLVDT